MVASLSIWAGGEAYCLATVECKFGPPCPSMSRPSRDGRARTTDHKEGEWMKLINHGDGVRHKMIRPPSKKQATASNSNKCSSSRCVLMILFAGAWQDICDFHEHNSSATHIAVSSIDSCWVQSAKVALQRESQKVTSLGFFHPLPTLELPVAFCHP